VSKRNILKSRYWVPHKKAEVVGTLFCLEMAFFVHFLGFVVVVSTKVLSSTCDGDKQQNTEDNDVPHAVTVLLYGAVYDVSGAEKF